MTLTLERIASNIERLTLGAASTRVGDLTDNDWLLPGLFMIPMVMREGVMCERYVRSYLEVCELSAPRMEGPSESYRR